jgi:hypothetical protein
MLKSKHVGWHGAMDTKEEKRLIIWVPAKKPTLEETKIQIG